MQQSNSQEHLGPRIYYLDPLAAGSFDQWGGSVERAAQLGFDHLLIPPIFSPGAGDDPFLVDDFAALNSAFGERLREANDAIAEVAQVARRQGMKLLLDMVPDRLAAGGAAASRGEGIFLPAPATAALDPRQNLGRLGSCVAAVTDAAAAARLAAWWAPLIERWDAAGVAGLRVLGLDRMPAAAEFLRGLRHIAPSATLIGWTPGMRWDALPALVGCGLDYVVSSLPWWDWRSDWVWDEWDKLRRIASVLACPEAPWGARLARAGLPPAAREAAVRRSVLLAGLVGDGWLMSAGVESGATEPMSPRVAIAPTAQIDLGATVRMVNADIATRPPTGAPRLITTADGPILALLRQDRTGDRNVVLANTSLTHHHVQEMAWLLPRIGVAALTGGDDGKGFTAASRLDLAPAAVLRLVGKAEAVASDVVTQTSADAARAAAAQPRVAIEAVTPSVENGRFPVKLLAGTTADIEADLICDGHDKLAARVLWRNQGDAPWQDVRMRPLVNDRWTARIPLTCLGLVHFVIEAWKDGFESFRDELAKKHAAGVPTSLELQEGRDWLTRAAERGAAPVAALLPRFDRADPDAQRNLLLSEDTAEKMRAADDRPMAARTVEYPIRAERLGAAFASWYEIFPRSMSDDPSRHGTFQDVIRHLPRIRDMGFDVLYFPPIHPIGRTNRKGRNNSLTPAPDDPGSPYAIGSAAGGHDAIHPELGTIEDFRALRDAASAEGLELALDFAIQCSPDHPWLSEHKGWFDWRPDGTIRYAENPPKKYEDIVNVDFYTKDAVPDLWLALANIVLFWASEGVRLFRVDNPHTKPLPFWEWLIGTVQARYPDTVFLAEAFTRPKVMYRLGKLGFSQSYTYFTWRNTPAEFREYLTELTTTAPRDFFRPHFFVNTPDINPEFLQTSGRPGFLIRAALAATLSGLWGVYNGFELCEGRPLAPGKEEYLDSEKYEIRAWDWDRPGNIVADIARLNRIRRANPCLQSHLGINFVESSNSLVLCFEKATPDRSNVLLVAISFDPFQAQECRFENPTWRWQLPDDAGFDTQDLLSEQRTTWHGKQQTIRLTPEEPFRIWRVRPAG